MPRATFLKRKMLIDRKMQLTVLGYTVMVVLLVSAMNVLFLNSSVGTLDGDEVSVSMGATAAYGIVGVLLAAALVIANLEITGRIAGPVFRLKSHIDGICNGDAPRPISFRKHDQFQDLAEAYNRLLAYSQTPAYLASVKKSESARASSEEISST